MGTQYKSLLGLTEVIADSAEISNIDLEATNITGLTTSRIPEGYNLYYTDARVSENPNVSSNTTHRERKDNPHGVTAAQVGIEDTDDIIEGVTNLYYTDIRFDDRLATKTTTSLAEGSNLYYTDARFDTRFGIKTTDDLTEGTNLYYTDARFDNRFGIKTTTDLTEGANLYYTDVRFDNRLLSKTTTDLTEGANLYYTDARFDARFGIKTTTNLTEGANLYYTTTRANADFDTRFGIKSTTDLTEGTNLYYTDVRFDTRFGIKTTTDLTEGTNLYYTDARFDNRFGIKTTTDLTEGTNLYYTTTRANADFDTRLATKTTDDLTEGKNNIYYTEARVSANVDVKNNTAYTAIGHLPLAGGTLTGDLTFELDSLEMPALTSNDGNTDFIVSASSEHYTGNYPAYIAFSDLTAEGWHIEGPYDYGGSNFLYNGNYGTIVNGSELKGQWIQVKTTSLYSVNSFVLSTSSGWVSRSPEDFTAVVSSDGINFTSIYSTTGLNWNGSLIKTFNNISQLTGYYFRLIVTRATAFNGLGIARWRITFNSYFHNINNVLNINGSDVNTIIEEVKTNSEYTAIGHLPLDGGTLTGDLSINGELNIGGEKITTAATNGLQLYGPSNDIGGPHIQAFVSTDDYPVFQQLNNSHGSIAMCFDAYADGFTWKSSSSESNAIIYKSNTDLEFSYSSGVAAGGEVIWNAGFSMDLANGLVSFSTGVDVTGDLTVSGTVDGVDLKALETAVDTNTAKVSYTDATKVGLISVTQAVNLDTMESNIATNNNKVSASGTINTHSDVNLNLLKDYEVLTYFSGEWKNMATQTPDTSAFLLANGTRAMTGNLNMGNQDIDNVNQIFVDRKNTGTNKIVLYDGGTPSTTNFYGFGVQGSTLLYNLDVSTSNHKFFYGGTNELFRIGNAGVYSYRNLDVTGNITVSGTVDGVDLKALETAVDTNSTKVSYTDATKVGLITVSQPTNLDTLSSDVKNNTAYSAVGHLPLDGGTMSGDIDMSNNEILKTKSIKFGISDAFDLPFSNTPEWGGWVVTQSSYQSNGGHRALNLFSQSSDHNTSRWATTSPDSFTGTGYSYNGTSSTMVNGSTILGAWANIHVPGATLVSSGFISRFFTTYAPEDFMVCVSADGVNFTKVYEITGTSWGNGSIKTCVNTTIIPGSHFRLIVTRVVNVSSLIIHDWIPKVVFATDSTIERPLNGNGCAMRLLENLPSQNSILQIDENGNLKTSSTAVHTTTPNGCSVILGQRNTYNEPQIKLQRFGDLGEGFIGFNASLLAWAATNQLGNPTSGYAYMSKGSNSWAGASDRRLKTNIVGLEVEDCCARIALLKPCNYCWKTDESKKRNTGFIADEVKQVYPDLVSNSNMKVGDDEDIEGIDYMGMIPILVGAIQSMMGKMNELKNRIEILEKPII